MHRLMTATSKALKSYSIIQIFSFNFRVQPLFWNVSAAYTKQSAENKLGIEKPKRPVTSFFKFLKQVRPTLIAKNPTTSATEIIKIASQHWHQLGDDVRN